MINGAMIAPNDCVENAADTCVPVALRLSPKKVPMVTYQDPQTKKFKNIMRDSLSFVPKGIAYSIRLDERGR
jgi:hypothetical protein